MALPELAWVGGFKHLRSRERRFSICRIGFWIFHHSEFSLCFISPWAANCRQWEIQNPIRHTENFFRMPAGNPVVPEKENRNWRSGLIFPVPFFLSGKRLAGSFLLSIAFRVQASGQAGDDGDEFHWVGWFGRMHVITRCRGPQSFFDVGVSRRCDGGSERLLSFTFGGAQSVDQFVTVHIRQADVRHQHIGALIAPERNRLCGAGRLPQFRSRRNQDCGK